MIRALALGLGLTTLASTALADALTATRVIRPMAVIGVGDLGILPRDVPGALTSGDDLVGLEARVTLYPGRPILPGQVGPRALVERNQPVTVVFRKHGLTIAADGRALSRGAEGDLVRVMNLASRTTVSGRVMDDGSVMVGQGRIAR